VAYSTRDPSIEAARCARSAEKAFMSVAEGPVGNEYKSEFRRAEARWQAAEEAFADSIPCSTEGALLKIDALIDLVRASGADDRSLEVRHLRAIRDFVVGTGKSRATDVLPVTASL
jgi:hypothetical protein